MSEPGDGDEIVPREPGGEPLTHGRRMTCREARSWMKRSDALIGRWHGPAIEWVPEDGRTTVAAEVKHAEGRDCNLQGDVVLYRLADSRPVIVIDY